MTPKELTNEEVNERIAILKRLKKLLEKQRSQFREYLSVLEHQESAINSSEIPDTEKLLAHTELETEIVSGLKSLQKVIVPLEDMYNAQDQYALKDKDSEIPQLKADLKLLEKKVLLQNDKNRELLKNHITVVRTQINTFKNPYKNKKSIYATQSHTASQISIEC